MSTLLSYIVRPFVTADAPSLLAAVRASLPDLANWMPWCSAGYALEHAEWWVDFAQRAWVERTEFPLGVFDAETGAVVGGTGVNHIVWAHRTGNIGYWVSTPHRQRGVARLSAQEAARLGFGEIGLTRLEIVTLPHNVASQRVAESLGATGEGLARNRLVVDGVACDAVVYSLVPEDAARWGSVADPRVTG